MTGRPLVRRERVELSIQAFLLIAAVPAAFLLPPCGLLSTFGVPCPLCGGRRAIEAIGEGQLHESVRWNVIIIPLLAAVALAAGSRLLSSAIGRDIRSLRGERIAAAALLGIVTAFYPLRLTGWAFPWPGGGASRHVMPETGHPQVPTEAHISNSEPATPVARPANRRADVAAPPRDSPP